MKHLHAAAVIFACLHNLCAAAPLQQPEAATANWHSGLTPTGADFTAAGATTLPRTSFGTKVMAENATRLTPHDQEEQQRQEKAAAERHRLFEEAKALETELKKRVSYEGPCGHLRAWGREQAWKHCMERFTSPEGQFQRGQELEKAVQMRPAMAAYRRAGEAGHPAAAKRMWELLLAQRASATEIALWQRRAFQIGAPGVPEPPGPTSR